MREKVIDMYSKYIEFDNLVKQSNEKLKDKDTLIASLTDAASAERLKDMYKDNILYNSQLRMHFENLMFFIALYTEDNDDLPEEIIKFYNDLLNYKTKTLFVVEKGEFVATDQEVLETMRKNIEENHPLFKLLFEKLNTQLPQ